MPRARKDLAEFRDEILRRISENHTKSQIQTWSAGQGLIVSRNTLSTRCTEWEANKTIIPSSDAALVAVVDTTFHTTDHDDHVITDNISAFSLPITHRQVKRIRLFHG
jgi:hypothetical protein